MPTIGRINVTPVKSTALDNPGSVRLESHGPTHDRLFFLVDGQGGWFGGDARTPLMLIHSVFDPQSDRLELRLSEGEVVEGAAIAGGEAISIAYEGRNVSAHIVEGDWSRILSAHCDRPMRLARLDEPGTLVDEPVTIVSATSVQDLGSRGGREALDAARFRMTFELLGCEPYEEDTWQDRRMTVGEAELEIGGSVPRCVITTLDPQTGRQDFSTLKTIVGYREPMPRGKAPFGRYARVTRPGTVRVGDTVELSS